MYTEFWWEKLKKKEPLRKSGRRWKKNIKVALTRNRLKGCRLDSSGSRQRQLAGSCKQGNEASGSMKRSEFYHMRNY